MDLNAESMRLERLSVPEMQAEYAGLTGEAVRSRHRGYMTRRILWWLQARAYGGLSERARSLAATLARDGDREQPPPAHDAPIKKTPRPAGRGAAHASERPPALVHLRRRRPAIAAMANSGSAAGAGTADTDSVNEPEGA